MSRKRPKMVRLKHTRKTSNCDHGKNKIKIPKKGKVAISQCRCWHRGKGKKLIRCGNKATLRAHMHSQSNTFAYVLACSACNRQWGSTMYARKQDVHPFKCNCLYRRMQSAHQDSYRKNEERAKKHNYLILDDKAIKIDHQRISELLHVNSINQLTKSFSTCSIS